MSEIRPTSQKPSVERAPMQRTRQTEHANQQADVHNDSQRTEAKREVVRHEMPKTDKPKGGNVDIRV